MGRPRRPATSPCPRPASARVRELSGNSEVASAGVQDSASAVPTPWPARAHRKSGQSGAAAQAAQPTAEISQADAEDQAMAEQVAQLAAHQHQRAVDQHVADDEPLHVAQRQPEMCR